MRWFRSLVVGAAAAVVMAIAVAAPAGAHDQLVASDPGAGDRLAVAPETVQLSFSGQVLSMGVAVVVVDQSDRDWVAAEPEVADGVVTALLEPDMPVGGYEVRWRVVSEDGHPISGVVPFTIGDAQPLSRAPAPDGSSPATAAPAEDDAQSAQDITAESGIVRTAIIGVAGAGAAVAVLILIRLFRRRTSAHGNDSPGDEPGTPNN